MTKQPAAPQPAAPQPAATQPAATQPAAPQPAAHEPDLIETLQSLIVAFVLAMTFRGFVVEGFVIPTGSMAPTLMGAHAQIQSRQTGSHFAVGMDMERANPPASLADPMLGPDAVGSAQAPNLPQRRMGDRILVLKSLYPFSQPHRFDVVVFKNPTRSQGDEANYIKRLIGLPNEELWLVDGDVFTRAKGESHFRIQRKPDHVQRAVWQAVHDSDYIPVNVDRLNESSRRRYVGPPWVGDSSAWNLEGRAWRYEGSGQTELRWDMERREIDDWTAYNMLVPPRSSTMPVAVSDVRVSATIVPDRDGLVASLEMHVRSHILRFVIEPTRAIITMRPSESPEGGPDELRTERAIRLPAAGRSFRVECWHVDQEARLFINGSEAVDPLRYEWSPIERLQNATGVFTTDDARALVDRRVTSPSMHWRFEGSPLTLHRVRVDRDLFYRRAWLEDRFGQPPAFGTHPDALANLGPEHYMMCGDNSQMSLDSRLWGDPDGLVSSQIDPAPFVVNRRLLLGKAWVVYFPAPYPMKEGGWPVIPDFGRLRFIR